MDLPDWVCLEYAGQHLTYADACRIAVSLASGRKARLIRLDLGQAAETTTGALARLVRLRASLLQNGGDLCVADLRGHAKGLYEIHRMERLLPQTETGVQGG